MAQDSKATGPEPHTNAHAQRAHCATGFFPLTPTLSLGERESHTPPRDETKLLVAQNARGRWVETGRLRCQRSKNSTARIINCATFIRHVQTLSRYLAAQSQ